jgi:predicted regulator of Ras-like GTPase activity (Roadblock/LC7/MglB family)
VTGPYLEDFMREPGGTAKGAEGFDGAVAGLGLSDVIQLNGINRFSGCIDVHSGSDVGLLFFRDGQIIHAEAGKITGEEAFYAIMQWPGGKFTLQPKVTTTSHSINRSWKFLLMEAHRLMDENRHVPPPPPVPSSALTSSVIASTESVAASPSGREKLNQIVEKMRKIPGVASVLLQAKDGTPAGDSPSDSDQWTEPMLHLAQFGRRMGEAFRSGEVVAATVQGADRNILLLATKNFLLTILIQGGSQAGAVEAEIRKLLSSRR